MTKNIKVLDDSTINKIAAGEVIERPSSVIKELLENSIDALATSITIEILNGGKTYIRVTDNGVGIEKDDIELAFLRHSTSKISNVNDLNSIETLGFRGEALASIASVSQIELITKTPEEKSGTKIIIHGGVVKSKEEIGCPNGITIVVKNLFFNTPVREKFLKSDNTEASHIGDIVHKLALSNPNVSFNYIKDNKSIIKTPGRGDLSTTIYSVLGKEFLNSTFEISNESDGLSLKGFLGKPDYTRANRNSQYIFINGRYIRDIGISRVIEKSYQTLIVTKRYPVFLIFLNIDTRKIDVNVHPTKTEVRFTNRDKLNLFISNTVKSVLQTNNLIPKVTFSNKRHTNIHSINDKPIETIDFIPTVEEQQQIIENKDLLKIIDFNKSDYEYQVKQKTPRNNYENFTEDKEGKVRKKIEKEENKNIDNEQINEKTCDIYEKTLLENVTRFPDIRAIGILFKTYILGQDKENKYFYMIDQHAAHERIMYERLKEQFLSEGVATQILLATDLIELSISEVEIVKDNLEVFLNLGFEIEDFGTNTIALRGVPLIFGKPNSKKLFLDILDNLENDISSNYELQLEKIMKLACSAAIKANDDLAKVEVEKLIEDLSKMKDPFTCPHGRPVIIEMNKEEIERKFKRT